MFGYQMKHLSDILTNVGELRRTNPFSLTIAKDFTLSELRSYAT